jgi:hypothetical protein
MMRLSNGEHTEDPLGRFRADWRLKARNARDTWLPGTSAIESALESTFQDAIRFAAAFIEKEGHIELAIKLRARVQRRA